MPPFLCKTIVPFVSDCFVAKMNTKECILFMKGYKIFMVKLLLNVATRVHNVTDE